MLKQRRVNRTKVEQILTTVLAVYDWPSLVQRAAKGELDNNRHFKLLDLLNQLALTMHDVGRHQLFK